MKKIYFIGIIVFFFVLVSIFSSVVLFRVSPNIIRKQIEVYLADVFNGYEINKDTIQISNGMKINVRLSKLSLRKKNDLYFSSELAEITFSPLFLLGIDSDVSVLLSNVKFDLDLARKVISEKKSVFVVPEKVLNSRLDVDLKNIILVINNNETSLDSLKIRNFSLDSSFALDIFGIYKFEEHDLKYSFVGQANPTDHKLSINGILKVNNFVGVNGPDFLNHISGKLNVEANESNISGSFLGKFDDDTSSMNTLFKFSKDGLSFSDILVMVPINKFSMFSKESIPISSLKIEGALKTSEYGLYPDIKFTTINSKESIFSFSGKIKEDAVVELKIPLDTGELSGVGQIKKPFKLLKSFKIPEGVFSWKVNSFKVEKMPTSFLELPNFIKKIDPMFLLEGENNLIVDSLELEGYEYSLSCNIVSSKDKTLVENINLTRDKSKLLGTILYELADIRKYC